MQSNQPVIWKVEFKDGSEVLEFDDSGKETVFTDILDRKQYFSSISLINKKDDKIYSINLLDGSFNIDSTIIHPSKEVDGRMLSFVGLNGYADGVIQYKCSNPITAGKNVRATAATYNIGYKISPENFRYETYSKGLVFDNYIIKAQPILSINAVTKILCFSITITVRVVFRKTGEERIIKL